MLKEIIDIKKEGDERIMSNEWECFNQKRFEKLKNKIKDGQLYLYSLEFYEFQLLRREKFRFLNPDKYNKINREF